MPMPLHLAMEDAVARLRRMSGPNLIGVDGLPCSGKTSLVDRVLSSRSGEAVSLDEFVRPKPDWPSQDHPAFPFDYIRYDDFVSAVSQLAERGSIQFFPFDWEGECTSKTPRAV